MRENESERAKSPAWGRGGWVGGAEGVKANNFK